MTTCLWCTYVRTYVARLSQQPEQLESSFWCQNDGNFNAVNWVDFGTGTSLGSWARHRRIVKKNDFFVLFLHAEKLQYLESCQNNEFISADILETLVWTSRGSWARHMTILNKMNISTQLRTLRSYRALSSVKMTSSSILIYWNYVWTSLLIIFFVVTVQRIV